MSHLYTYRAVNEQGQLICGHLAGAHQQDVRQKLLSQRLQPLTVRSRQLFSLLSQPRAAAKQEFLFTFCLYLEHFCRSGLPLLEGLQEISQNAQGAFQTVMLSVAQSLCQGVMLSDALAQQPHVFDAIFVQLVRVGEKTGNLEKTFAQLGAYVQQKQEWRTRIQQSLRYPLFVCLAFVGALWGLFSFLVPVLVEFLVSQDIPLPLATRTLMAFAACFSAPQLPVVMGGIASISFILWGLFHHKPTAMLLYRMGFQLPLWGPLWSKTLFQPVFYGLSLMTQQGVHIVDGLKIIRHSLRQPYMVDALAQMEHRIMAGHTFSQALKDHPLLVSGLVARLIRLGEETGSLATALQQVSGIYTREIHKTTERLIGLLEPTMVCLLGAVLSWIVMGTFMPIYESFDQIHDF